MASAKEESIENELAANELENRSMNPAPTDPASVAATKTRSPRFELKTGPVLGNVAQTQVARARFGVGDAVFVQLKSASYSLAGTRVGGDTGMATVRFRGPTSFAKGEWIGVELDEPCGKNSGTVRGVKYFECRPGHGLLVRSKRLCMIAAAPSTDGPRSVRDFVGCDDVMALIVAFLGSGNRYGPAVAFADVAQLTLLVPGLLVVNQLNFGAQGRKHLVAAGNFVTELNLSCDNFDFVFAALKANSSVKRITLRRCTLLTGARPVGKPKEGCGRIRLLADALAANATLEELTFSQCDFQSDMGDTGSGKLRDALGRNTGLRSLTFKGAHFFGTGVAQSWFCNVTEGLARSGTLRELHIDNDQTLWPTNGFGVSRTPAHMDALEVLSLRMCAHHVHMGRNLRKLAIEDSEACAAHFARQSMGYFLSLEEVSLIACGLSSDACLALAEHLLENRTLKKLDVSNNPGLGGNMTFLLQALGASTVLQRLGITNCDLSGSEWLRLAEACHDNETLTHLAVNMHTTDDAECQASAQAAVQLVQSLVGPEPAQHDIGEVLRKMGRYLDVLQIIDAPVADPEFARELAGEIVALFSLAGTAKVLNKVRTLDNDILIERTCADVLLALVPRPYMDDIFEELAFNHRTVGQLIRPLFEANVADLQSMRETVQDFLYSNFRVGPAPYQYKPFHYVPN